MRTEVAIMFALWAFLLLHLPILCLIVIGLEMEDISCISCREKRLDYDTSSLCIIILLIAFIVDSTGCCL